MPDEINFMDLVVLLRINQDTPLEKLGSALNASIFDASNVAGTLKQKGLIEFRQTYPGPSLITVTEAGQALIKEADTKAAGTLDPLDETVLSQLSGGRRLPIELQNTLNIRPRDLAMRLYKLNKQNFLIYELKNGGVELLLTERGFLTAKTVQMNVPQQAMQADSQDSPVQPKQPEIPPDQNLMQPPKKGIPPRILVMAVLLAVLLLLIYLLATGHT